MADFSSLPVTELTSGAILVFILQQLKKIPWVEVLPPWAFRIVSIVWALISTLIVARATGAQTSFPQHSQAVEAGIDLWFVASQVVIQEILYRITGKETLPPETPPAPVTSPATPANPEGKWQRATQTGPSK